MTYVTHRIVLFVNAQYFIPMCDNANEYMDLKLKFHIKSLGLGKSGPVPIWKWFFLSEKKDLSSNISTVARSILNTLQH